MKSAQIDQISLEVGDLVFYFLDGLFNMQKKKIVHNKLYLRLMIYNDSLGFVPHCLFVYLPRS